MLFRDNGILLEKGGDHIEKMATILISMYLKENTTAGKSELINSLKTYRGAKLNTFVKLVIASLAKSDSLGDAISQFGSELLLSHAMELREVLTPVE